MKVVFAEPAPTELEQKAARTIVEPVGGAQPAMGFGPPGGGRAGAGQPPDPAIAAALRKIPSEMTGEVGVLVGQKKTVLEIRDFISGEFYPVPIEDVIAYFEARQKMGAVKLVEQPVELKKGAKKPAVKK